MTKTAISKEKIIFEAILKPNNFVIKFKKPGIIKKINKIPKSKSQITEYLTLIFPLFT